MARRSRASVPPGTQQTEDVPVGARRGYVRPLVIAMVAVAAFALIWAAVQGAIQ